MLVSLGWQIPYERETRDKKTNAEDGCTGPLAHNDSATHFTLVNWTAMDLYVMVLCPWSPRRAGGVPGPVSQRGPTQATAVVTPSRCVEPGLTLHDRQPQSSVLGGGDYTVARKVFGMQPGGPSTHRSLNNNNNNNNNE